MGDLSSGAEVGRVDIHRPVEFAPENYMFVGCFHNTYTFTHGRNHTTLQTRHDDLVALLDSNIRPNGPGYSNCDHCGAAIAFCGVFQHIPTGEYIVVGSTCAEKRFPMANKQFQDLRKAHRLCRVVDLASAKFEAFKLEHPEVDWAAAEASTDPRIRFALSQGRKYGSLYDYRLVQITGYLAAAAQQVNHPHVPAAPVAPQAPVVVNSRQDTVVAWLEANANGNGFLTSVLTQAKAGKILSVRQLECVEKNIAKANAPAPTPEATALKDANQALTPGMYIAADGTIWKVQGNMTYKSAAKRAVQAKLPFDPSQVSGARVYALVWQQTDGTRLTLATLADQSQAQGWTFIKGAITTLVVDHKMTVEEAKHFASLYSQCVWCGKHLEDTASYGTKFIEQGIGPVCIKYVDATVKAPELARVVGTTC